MAAGGQIDQAWIDALPAITPGEWRNLDAAAIIATTDAAMAIQQQHQQQQQQHRQQQQHNVTCSNGPS